MRNRSHHVVGIALIAVLSGCGETESPISTPPPCEKVGDTCVGLPAEPVCEGSSCTAGVSCSKTIDVSTDAALASAAAGASPGTCIALAPGTYGAVSLPPGVSLLGKSASDVRVGVVTIGAGSGAVLRGLETSGVEIEDAATATLDAVRVSKSANSGVFVHPKASVSITQSTIEGAATYGIYAVDAAEVKVHRAIVEGSGGPGIWLASSEDCPAPSARAIFDAKTSIVRDSHIVGVALFGATATATSIDILGTLHGATLQTSLHGGGISIAACSEVTLMGMRVKDNATFGVLVDASKGKIAGLGAGDRMEISGNVVGISIQHTTEELRLEDADLDKNYAVGIDVSGGAQGVVICRTGVKSTQKRVVPTFSAGNVSSEEVGHGFTLSDASWVDADSVELSGNATASMLFDGQSASVLSRVTLSGGDEGLGIVQQNYMGGMPIEATEAPMVQVFASEELPVPLAPKAMSKSLHL